MVFLCGDSFRLASDIEKARSALQRSSGGTPEEHAGLLDMEKVERAGRRLNEAMCSFVVEKIGGDISSLPFERFSSFPVDVGQVFKQQQTHRRFSLSYFKP
jgi:phage terminase Nu1 subunit (DNA packaging protein)